VAHEITWRRGHVAIRTRTPEGGELPPIEARCALVTLPAGVLKRPPGDDGAIAFAPEVPRKRAALERIGMARVIKLVLDFGSAPWERAPFLLAAGLPAPAEVKFLHAREAPVPTWWTALPERVPRLVAWSGGPAAARLASGGDALLESALEALAQLLGLESTTLASDLQAWHTHDWDDDPFARGAYSYLRPGAGRAREELAEPIEDTLFFAGEATCANGRDGTVDGALASGHRAAREIQNALTP
jgi:monoamine oxidase